MKLSALRFPVLLIAGALVAVPQDLVTAFQSLKEAEATKDAAKVKKLAAETCALARQAASEPAPKSAEEKEAWAKNVAYARDVELYTEYALYATAVQAPPATTVDLLSALEQQNPKSKYLEDAYGQYFFALTKAGAASKIPTIAEKAIAHFPDNEDLLLVLADTAMSHKQSDRALGFAQRLVAVLSQHPRPEGISAADWQRKRNSALCRGHWIAGMVQSANNQYIDADKNLRAALPLIEGNDAMKAAALFYLGVVNYQLGRAMLNRARVLEAAKFSEQAAYIKGPYAEQAWRNSGVMRAEAQRMR